ncbi:AAA family ATPase [Streptomyces sp. NPDC002643]
MTEASASASASGERSVAAGRDIGNVSTGDHVTQIAKATMLPPEALSLDPGTARICHLPYRTEQFVGRERELRLLDEAFGRAGGVVVHAVHGLGGIGKSTLAAHWAAAHTSDFNPVWWITAESASELDAGLAALGRALQPALVGVLTEDALRERTVQWLASNDDWLVVLDNVSDPSAIQPLLARAPSGRFLVTTRRGPTSWRGIARTLELDVLAPDEAVELFTGVYDGPPDGVEELCDELGRLPLAVDQAAAYCREAGVTPRAYLELLARRPADMHAATAEGGDAHRTVARVWQVTLDRLADTPAAQGILRTIAWWAPDGIPRAYLDGLTDPVELNEGLRRLVAYSMIRLRGDTLSVHRLVQAVTRTAEPELAEGLRNFVARRLHEVRPVDTLWGEAAQVWATHAEAMASCTSPDSDTEEMATLFILAATYLAKVDVARGKALYGRGVAVLERLAGDDPDSAVVMSLELPLFHLASGDYDQAVPLLERNLAEATAQFGAGDPRTLRERDLVAVSLWNTDPVRAAALARENVEHATLVLSPNDPMLVGFRLKLTMLTWEDPDLSAIDAQLAEVTGVLDEHDAHFAALRRMRLDALIKAGETRVALELAERLIVLHRDFVGDLNLLTVDLRMKHIRLLTRVGEWHRATELLDALMAECVAAAGGDRQDDRPLQHVMSYVRELSQWSREHHP